MKYKSISLFLFVLIINTVCAQESVKLELRFKPNKIYKIITEVNSDNCLNFEGDSLFLEKIKSNGIQIPLKGVSIQNIENKFETGNLETDKSMKVFMKVEKYEVKSSMNGLELKDTSKNFLKNLSIEGMYRPDNSISNVITSGEGVPEYLKTFLAQMMSEMLNKIKFPENPVKIGESFSQEVPLKFPIPDVGTLNMKILNKYLLDKIEDGNSYFNIFSTIEVSQNDPKFTVEASGAGGGVFIYNIKEEFYSVYDLDMDKEMKMGVNGFTVVVKGNSKTKIKCEVN